MIRDRRREDRAWALHCAIATAAAQTEAGQEYVARLWAAVAPSSVKGDRADPSTALSAADEQANAQARLDGAVRSVAVGRREG